MPLTDWEDANDARTDAHNDGNRRIRVLAKKLYDITADKLADRIQRIKAVAISEQRQEFEPEAAIHPTHWLSNESSLGKHR